MNKIEKSIKNQNNFKYLEKTLDIYNRFVYNTRPRTDGRLRV